MLIMKKPEIIIQLKEICKQLDRFPTATDLIKLRKFNLSKSIVKTGGYIYYREMFGYKLIQRPANFWKNNYKIELEKIILKLNRFPHVFEIKQHEMGLYQYLSDNKLLDGLKKEYNYKPLIKPVGYWNDFNNLKLWLLENFKELIIELKKFPTATMINSSNITDVILKHGGFIKVAEKMGCDTTKKLFVSPDGHYLDSTLELIVDWYLWSRDIKHSVHGRISSMRKYKYDFKIDDFYVEVWGLSGTKKCDYDSNRLKKEELYKTLNLNLISIEKEIFEKPFLEIEKSLDAIFSSNKFDVTKKITSINLEESISGYNYWNFSNTLLELKKVIEQIGKFPSTSILKSMQKKQIQKSMQKHGGQNVFRKILGFPLLKQRKIN